MATDGSQAASLELQIAMGHRQHGCADPATIRDFGRLYLSDLKRWQRLHPWVGSGIGISITSVTVNKSDERLALAVASDVLKHEIDCRLRLRHACDMWR
jgi:hypothetical protein